MLSTTGFRVSPSGTPRSNLSSATSLEKSGDVPGGGALPQEKDSPIDSAKVHDKRVADTRAQARTRAAEIKHENLKALKSAVSQGCAKARETASKCLGDAFAEMGGVPPGAELALAEYLNARTWPDNKSLKTAGVSLAAYGVWLRSVLRQILNRSDEFMKLDDPRKAALLDEGLASLVPWDPEGAPPKPKHAEEVLTGLINRATEARQRPFTERVGNDPAAVAKALADLEEKAKLGAGALEKLIADRLLGVLPATKALPVTTTLKVDARKSTAVAIAQQAAAAWSKALPVVQTLKKDKLAEDIQKLAEGIINTAIQRGLGDYSKTNYDLFFNL